MTKSPADKFAEMLMGNLQIKTREEIDSLDGDLTVVAMRTEDCKKLSSLTGRDLTGHVKKTCETCGAELLLHPTTPSDAPRYICQVCAMGEVTEDDDHVTSPEAIVEAIKAMAKRRAH